MEEHIKVATDLVQNELAPFLRSYWKIVLVTTVAGYVTVTKTSSYVKVNQLKGHLAGQT